MVDICKGLRGSASIKSLNLGANALGMEGAKALADGGAFVSSLTQARAAVCSPMVRPLVAHNCAILRLA